MTVQVTRQGLFLRKHQLDGSSRELSFGIKETLRHGS